MNKSQENFSHMYSQTDLKNYLTFDVSLNLTGPKLNKT